MSGAGNAGTVGICLAGRPPVGRGGPMPAQAPRAPFGRDKRRSE
jgi:hypothetical protein